MSHERKLFLRKGEKRRFPITGSESKAGTKEYRLGQPLSPEMHKMYQHTVASARVHFERMKPLVEQLSPTARVLCINTTGNYPTQLEDFSLLDPERQALTLDATFGDRNTPRDQRSAADAFRYMLGFQPDDPRFEIWNPLEPEAKKPERNPADYDAVIVTGSELMVTDLRRMIDLYRLPMPGVKPDYSLEELEGLQNLALRLQRKDPTVIMWDRLMKFIAKWDETSYRIGLFVCFGHQAYNDFRNANPHGVQKSILSQHEGKSDEEFFAAARKGRQSVNWMKDRIFGPVQAAFNHQAEHHPLLKGMRSPRRKITTWASHRQYLETFPSTDWEQPVGKLLSDPKLLASKVNSRYEMVAYRERGGAVLTTQSHPELNAATMHVLADLRYDVLRNEGFNMRKFEKLLRRKRESADLLRDTISPNLISLVTKQHWIPKKIDRPNPEILYTYTIDSSPIPVSPASLWSIVSAFYPDDLAVADITSIIEKINESKKYVTASSG